MTQLKNKILTYSLTGLTAWLICVTDHDNTRKNLLRECRDLACVTRISQSTPIHQQSNGPQDIYRTHFKQFLDYRNVWIVTQNHQVTEVHVDDPTFEAKLINELPD